MSEYVISRWKWLRLLWLLAVPGVGISMWKLWVLFYPIEPITATTAMVGCFYMGLCIVGRAFGLED